MEMQKTNIEFRVDKKLVKFNIIHNLPEQFGLSIGNALENWLVRTNKFTAKSFCDYINSKSIHIAMTEAQYNKIIKIST